MDENRETKEKEKEKDFCEATFIVLIFIILIYLSCCYLGTIFFSVNSIFGLLVIVFFGITIINSLMIRYNKKYSFTNANIDMIQIILLLILIVYVYIKALITQLSGVYSGDIVITIYVFLLFILDLMNYIKKYKNFDNLKLYF